MKYPNAASVLVLLASAALLVAAATRTHSNALMVDRSFLGSLTDLPHSDGPRWDRAADVIWQNYENLIYLTRTGDPAATRVVQRLLVFGRVPGGCSCSPSELARGVFGGATLTDRFIRELAALSSAEQARVLPYIDYAAELGMACDACWPDDRREFLSAHPGVLAFYKDPDAPTGVHGSADEPPIER